MLLIILYLLLFLIVQLFTNHIRNEHQRLVIQRFFVFSLLFIFFGFRDISVLNDTVNYYEDQINLGQVRPGESIFNVELLSVIEPGFQVFQRFIYRYIWTDPYAINLIPALLCSFVFVQIVGKLTNRYIPLVAFIYLGLGDMFLFYTATRQALAACLFWYAMYKRDKGAKILPFIIVAFAILFHKTAIVCFIPLGLSFMNLSKRNIFIFLVAIIIVTISLQPILTMLNYTESKYLNDSDDNSANSGTPVAAILIAITYLAFYIWSLYNCKKYLIHTIKSTLLWNSLICLVFAFGSITTLIYFRFSIYFSIYIVLLFITVAESVPRKVFKTARVIIIWLLLIRTCIVLEYRNEWYHLVPYSFYNFDGRIHDTSSVR